MTNKDYIKAKEKALADVKKDGVNLKNHPDFCDDIDVVLEAVKNETMAYGDKVVLSYASPRLRDNEEVVRTAVTEAGLSLEYASPRLKCDKEIVKLAVAEEPYSFKYAASTLRDDIEFVAEIVAISPVAFKCASSRLRTHEKSVRKLMEINPLVAKYCEGDLLKNKLKEELKAAKKNSKKR